MLVISKAQVESLRDSLGYPSRLPQCRRELERMIDIKHALLWRADMGIACVGWQLPARLAWEVSVLEKALDAANESDVRRAASALDEYLAGIIEPA